MEWHLFDFKAICHEKIDNMLWVNGFHQIVDGPDFIIDTQANSEKVLRT